MEKNHMETISSLQPKPGPVVRYAHQIKPISYVKTHAAEVLDQIAEQREPLLITQNGEARAVLQDVASFLETQQSLALLKILALGNLEIDAGQVASPAEVRKRLLTRRLLSA
jgi:prevent-host-death family protein